MRHVYSITVQCSVVMQGGGVDSYSDSSANHTSVSTGENQQADKRWKTKISNNHSVILNYTLFHPLMELKD